MQQSRMHPVSETRQSDLTLGMQASRHQLGRFLVREIYLKRRGQFGLHVRPGEFPLRQQDEGVVDQIGHLRDEPLVAFL